MDETEESDFPRHNHDGWKLADYDWDEVSGIGRYTYRREEEKFVVDKVQRVSDEFHTRMAEERDALLGRPVVA